MKTLHLTFAAILVATATPTLPAFGADEPPALAARRERAERLEERARDLKAAGQHDQALRLMRQAEELRLEPSARPDPARREARLADLRAEGRQQDPARLRERPGQFSPPGDRPFRFRLGPPEFERPGQPAPSPLRREQMDRRMHHFELAIENLRAAGLPELAERLARERERIAERLSRGSAQPGLVPQELGRLRAELNELSEVLRNLRAQVEELHREQTRP